MNLSDGAKKWLAYRPSIIRRKVDKLRSLFYIKFPTLSGAKADIKGIFYSAFRLSGAAVITLSPIWAQYLHTIFQSLEQKKQRPAINEWIKQQPNMVWIGVGVIFIAQIYALWYDKLYKKNIDIKETIDARTKHAVSVNYLYENLAKEMAKIGLDSLYEKEKLQWALHEYRRTICSCILQELRIFLNDIEGRFIEVTLVVYHDDSGNNMRVDSRGDGKGRKTHRLDEHSDSSEMFPNAAAYRSDYSIIHHFTKQKWFAVRSVTDPSRKPKYESILCVPIREADNPITKVFGVICLDSTKPYHFYRQEAAIVKIIASYAGLMKTFINSPALNVESKDITTL